MPHAAYSQLLLIGVQYAPFYSKYWFSLFDSFRDLPKPQTYLNIGTITAINLYSNLIQMLKVQQRFIIEYFYGGARLINSKKRGIEEGTIPIRCLVE